MKKTYPGKHQLHFLTCLLLAVPVALIGSSTAAYGQDVSTSFEFNDTSGSFTLGTSPRSVTFTNGLAQTVGNFSLYHTGTHSFMVNPGNTATITFETPASSVTLWLRDQSSTSVLTALDENSQVISTVNATAASWTEVQITPECGKFVGSITLQNNGGGFAVIDDFSFTAGQATSGQSTVLIANFMNGNNSALNSRVYLFNGSDSAGPVCVRVFTLPLINGAAQELTGTSLDLGVLAARSALNLKLAEDILTPVGIIPPYTVDGGNLTLEITVHADKVRGAAQVFSSDFAFGTYPLVEIPSTSAGSPTVLVASFMNGNLSAFNSRIYLWNPSTSAGTVTVRVFSLPLTNGVAQELTGAPLSLGTLASKAARNIKLAEDILTPLGITPPYTSDGGNLTLEITVQAADVVGAAQVFSSDFAFGTYPLQVIQ